MYNFSKTSRKRLNECESDLQIVCNEAIKYVDFTVITGHRTKKEQNEKVRKGYSKVKWPKGKHNSFPSKAVDIAPYIKPYGVITGHPDQIRDIALRRNVSLTEARAFVYKSYARLIGILEGIAHQNKISLRVGLDWDGDFDLLDQTFHDLGHLEIKDD